MSPFLTINRHGYSVQFSPFNADRLVVASSLYYGLAGGGSLHVLDLNGETIKEISQYQWSDGLFDVAFSESDENYVTTSSGDGSLQLWNISNEDTTEKSFLKPVCCYSEHKSEVYSINWNHINSNNQIISASWDSTIKLWDPTRTKSLATYSGHAELAFAAAFSPRIPNIFCSVGSDGMLKLWNTLDSKKPFSVVSAHEGEVLDCDWSRFENFIASTGSDGLIRGWDLRNLTYPIFELFGFEYAVRKIKFSPHSRSVLVSANYDFTTRIWDYAEGGEAIEILTHHKECVYGVDWNPIRKNTLSTCGWDSLVHVFVPKSLKDV